jgi:hydrocephalus-inducing protein
MYLFYRFNLFESSLREIDNVLQFWDRATGTINRPDTPRSDNQEPEPPPPPTVFSKKGRGDKKEKEKEKEKEREREKAKEVFK